MGVVLILSEGTSHFQLWRYLERSIEEQQFHDLTTKPLLPIHYLQIQREIAMKHSKYNLPAVKTRKLKYLMLTPFKMI